MSCSVSSLLSITVNLVSVINTIIIIFLIYYLLFLTGKDIYGCMADIGWATGHSYIIYGPLACGATTFMFEGVPYYPTPSRYWDMVDRHQINQFYTAPTAIRHLMRVCSFLYLYEC